MSDAQKWLKRIPGLLTFFMVIALGATLANLLWLVLTPTTADAQAADLKVSSQLASNSKQENYGKIIADQHIFGAIPKKAPTKVVAPKPKPKVVKPAAKPLNLKLHGIIASNSGNGGFAMISYNGKTQEVYRQDEAIPKIEKDKEGNDKKRELDGVFVQSISDTEVVINNNGTEQVISLLEVASTASRSSIARKSLVSKPRTFSSSVERAQNDNGPQIQTKEEIKNNAQAKTLTELREQALQDPSVLMSVFTPSIVRKDGAVTGIRVYPSTNRALFRDLGLQNGDIVTQVNDVIIDDTNKGMEIFQQISDATSLSITVTRGGNEQVLTPQF